MGTVDITKFKQSYNLSLSEEKVLEYILENIDAVLELGVRGVAKKCYSSTSVVMNLSKKLHYSGFLDMVYNLKFQFSENNESLKLDENSDSYRNFAEVIQKKREKIIYVVGKGFSKMVAEYMYQKFLNCGILAVFSDFREIYENPYPNSGMLLIVSKSGETDHPLELCKKCKLSGIEVALFTGNSNSSLAKLSDYVIKIEDGNILDGKNIGLNLFFANAIIAFEKIMAELNEMDRE